MQKSPDFRDEQQHSTVQIETRAKTDMPGNVSVAAYMYQYLPMVHIVEVEGHCLYCGGSS